MRTVLYPVNKLLTAGAEQQLLALVRGLNKERFRPIVATLYPGGGLEEQFHAIPGAELIDLGRRRKYDFTPLWKVARLLRTRQVDIVQPFLTPSTFFGLLPALLVRTPVTIVTERCGVRRERGAGNKAYRAIEDWLTHFADSVVPNSVAGGDILRERGIGSEKIRVIYNGIDRERLRVDEARRAANRAQLDVPEGGQVVGILATLSPAKDHATFLRAAAIVAEDPAVRFAIIGDGPLRRELEELAASLGIGDRVTFFGYQRHVADYLAACDLLVSSSRDNEGCSNSILEGMALGLPIVATYVGGNGELVEDGVSGFLVPVGDHNAVAGAIRRAFRERAATAAIVAQARRMVATRFSHEAMVAEYEGLYTRLLAAHRRIAPVPALPPRTHTERGTK